MLPSCASLLLIFGHLADPAFDAPGPIPHLPGERTCALAQQQCLTDWQVLNDRLRGLEAAGIGGWQVECLRSQVKESDRLWKIWDLAHYVQIENRDEEERAYYVRCLVNVEPEGFASGRLPLPLSSRGWR